MEKKISPRKPRQKKQAEEKTENPTAGEGDIQVSEVIKFQEIVEGTKTKEQVITTTTESWVPKTSIGRKVKSGEISDIAEILDKGDRILEPEVTDILLPNMTVDLLMIGQSKGKFGGGQKRVFKQTQKKTEEGNKPKFSTCAVVGNNDGYVGLGYGKSRETVPAREKAIRDSKLHIIKIRRGCGDWRCGCREPHTIPFAVRGKCGSVVIELFPAPKGVGLKAEKECAKLLKLAGIKDIWARTFGQTRTKINLLRACFSALGNLMKVKVTEEKSNYIGIIEGSTSSKIIINK